MSAMTASANGWRADDGQGVRSSNTSSTSVVGPGGTAFARGKALSSIELIEERGAAGEQLGVHRVHEAVALRARRVRAEALDESARAERVELMRDARHGVDARGGRDSTAREHGAD